MFAAGKLLTMGLGAPSPPYPTFSMLVGSTGTGLGYIQGIGGSLSSNVWSPNPSSTIFGIFRNTSNGYIFLQVSGPLSDDATGNWSFLRIASTTFMRSAAVIAGDGSGQMTYRWTSGTNPIGSAGNTRVIEVG